MELIMLAGIIMILTSFICWFSFIDTSVEQDIESQIENIDTN